MVEDADGWNISTLRHMITSVMDERDRRYDQRFQEQLAALVKSEAVIEKRFVRVEQLRDALDDLRAVMMTRQDYQTRHDQLTERLEMLTHKMETHQGMVAGSKDTKAAGLAFVAIVIAIAAVAADVITFFIHR